MLSAKSSIVLSKFNLMKNAQGGSRGKEQMPMTVTLKLNDEELYILRPLADAEGVDIETVLHALIAQLIPPSASKRQGNLEERTKEERTKEERAEEEAELRREQEEMQANIARWHAEATIS
jgi:ribosomal protein L12E/L44/L45/RPP1/RPP2